MRKKNETGFSPPSRNLLGVDGALVIPFISEGCLNQQYIQVSVSPFQFSWCP